jgi:hypothetical protein
MRVALTPSSSRPGERPLRLLEGEGLSGVHGNVTVGST